jgi:hypothetical protein
MKKYIVAIQDKKMKFYPTVMIVDDTREASRSFLQHLNNDDNPMSNAKEDYSLVQIGEIIELEPGQGDPTDFPVLSLTEIHQLLVDGSQAYLTKED